MIGKFSEPNHRLAGWIFWRNKRFPISEIAKITNTNVNSIHARFKKLKIYAVDGRYGKSYSNGLKSKISNDCLKAFTKEDFNQAEIGKCCNLSRERIRQRMKDAGINYNEILNKRRKKKFKMIMDLVNKGFSIVEIQDKLKGVIDSQAILIFIKYHKIKTFNGNIPRKRLSEIWFLRNKGYSKSEIAKKLNTTPQCLTKITNNMKIKFVNGIKGYVV